MFELRPGLPNMRPRRETTPDADADLGSRTLAGTWSSANPYQLFGEVVVSFPAHAKASAYRRDLDLAEASAHVSYGCAGVTSL